MEQAVEKKHSEFGLASLCLCLPSIILLIIFSASDITRLFDLGAFSRFCLLVGLPFVTLLLGIAGLFQRDKKRFSAVVGVILSGTMIYLGSLVYSLLTYLQ